MATKKRGGAAVVDPPWAAALKKIEALMTEAQLLFAQLPQLGAHPMQALPAINRFHTLIAQRAGVAAKVWAEHQVDAHNEQLPPWPVVAAHANITGTDPHAELSPEAAMLLITRLYVDRIQLQLAQAGERCEDLAREVDRLHGCTKKG